MAAGLSALALAHSLPAFLIAWSLIGLGMGAGLYDPAFATLGRLYGHGGRSAITTLTLFGGFASTVCWPLSAFLDAHLGWRGACLVYAGFQLAVALPAYLFVLPREPQRPAPLPGSANSPLHAPARPELPGKRVVSLARRDHHAEFGDLDDALGSFADGLASQGAHPRCRRGPRRARWTLSGSGPRGRDGHRALSSSDLDEGRLHLARRHGIGGVVARSADHPTCLSALRRGHRARKHRQRHAAARGLRPRALSRHYGPHRHAEPHCSGGGPVDRRGFD